MSRSGRPERLRNWLFCGFLASLLGCAAGGGVTIPDVDGDDHGPGGYRYPSHPAFPAGSFDLARLNVRREKSDWVFEVEFASRIETAQVFLTRDERASLWPQTVDIYLAFADETGSHREALPGRNVAFAAGHEWSRAVVLSPLPRLLKETLEKTVPDAADVFVPQRVELSGKRLRARVPARFLGEGDIRGLAVLVSGTRFFRSFEVADRLRDRFAPDGLAMPVEAAPGECRLDDPQGMGCHFSGCAPCGHHPQVIDMLAGPGFQERWLRRYDPETGRTAEIELMILEAR
ncbi:MAG: hypothetical protein GYA21_01360 [Myxococcales bacterium]|nr:hypothetical protein [Myxococcales bacterium]